MKKKFLNKVIAVVLMLVMSFSTTGAAFAQASVENDLDLQYESYTTDKGYYENGSYVLNGIRYEYEQFNSIKGDIFLDIYEMSSNRSSEGSRVKTQSIYADAEESVLYMNGVVIGEIPTTTATTFDISTTVERGDTIFYDIQRYTAEALAVSIISASFSGGLSVGISVVLGVAVAILEGFYGTFNLEYVRYTTYETFPPHKPGISITVSSYCDYFNKSTGEYIKSSGTVVNDYI